MPREDLDNLLSACIPFAQQMLTKHGTFYPFAYGMSPAGEISMAASYDDQPGVTTEQIFRLLVDGLRAHAHSGQYKAVALCVDARVDSPDGSGKTDAIRVTLEENGGEAVNVFMPYRKRLLRGIAYGEIFGSEADHSVFV
jgi:hypothetical protein